MPASTEKNIGIHRWKCVKYYQKCVKFARNCFKNSSASGGLRSPDPYRGSAPGPRWGTSVPRPPCGFAPIPKLLPPSLRHRLADDSPAGSTVTIITLVKWPRKKPTDFGGNPDHVMLWLYGYSYVGHRHTPHGRMCIMCVTRRSFNSDNFAISAQSWRR